MAIRLYPPIIENSLPAFYGTSLEVPFEMNSTVGKESIEGFILQLRSLTSNALIINNVSTNIYDIAKGIVTFTIPNDKLNVGQYYKLQIAYLPSGYSKGNAQIAEHEIAYKDICNMVYDGDESFELLKSKYKAALTQFGVAYSGLDETTLMSKGIEEDFETYWNETIEYSAHRLIVRQLQNTSFETANSTMDDEVQALLANYSKYDAATDTIDGYASLKTYYNELYNKMISLQNAYVKQANMNQDYVRSVYGQYRSGYNVTDIEKVYNSTGTAFDTANSSFLNTYVSLANIMEKNDSVKFERVRNRIKNIMLAALNASERAVNISDDYPVVGYYSSTAVIKYTGTPSVGISGLSVGRTSSLSSEFNGTYENPDATERVRYYGFTIKDSDGNIIESVSNCIHNSNSDSTSDGVSSTDSYTMRYLMENGQLYSIQYTVETLSGMTISSPIYNITRNAYIDLGGDLNFTATVDNDYGCVRLKFQSTDTTYYTGTFLLSRLHTVNGKTQKTKLKKVNLVYELTDENPYVDYTPEHGVEYQYIMERVNAAGVYSKPLAATNTATGGATVKVNFEDIFLYDGKKQLRVRYNPKISSFKQDVLESKTDTIGSKYPFIFRNGSVSYKEFPISGLISRLENESFGAYVDTTSILDYSPTDLVPENMKEERDFKLSVLEWLTDGQPKLFRSPAEGNYIVRLMNTSLSPQDTLGRMLHTFSCTAYEVAAYDYDGLIKYGMLQGDSDASETIVRFSSHQLVPADKGSDNIFPTISAKIRALVVDHAPAGSIIKIDNVPIMIGATGCYEIPYGANIQTISLPNDSTAPNQGVITIQYDAYTVSAFDLISGAGVSACPVATVIGHGYEPSDPVVSPLLEPNVSTAANAASMKEVVTKVNFLRFFPRPLEHLQCSDYESFTTYIRINNEWVNALNPEVCALTYISRLPLYYVTQDNKPWYTQIDIKGNNIPFQIIDLGYIRKPKGSNYIMWKQEVTKDTLTSVSDSNSVGFFEAKIYYKDDPAGLRPVILTVDKQRSVEIRADLEISKIELGVGVYMEMGYEIAETSFMLEQTSTDPELLAAKASLNVAKTNLITARDTNQNWTDKTQDEYYQHYLSRILLERQYLYAKSTYNNIVNKLVAQDKGGS